MSSRPTVPRISTGVSRDNVSASRVSFTNSPLNACSSVRSPVRADSSMSSRKRPPESRSRGNSPPNKRSRPQQPRLTLQNRYADPGSPAILSPPPSRHGSFVGMPANVPKGPRGYSNHRRPNTSSERHPNDELGRGVGRDFRVMSPSSIGSGASTPTHHVAPPAPSMVPASTTSVHRQDENTTDDLSLRSLRRTKDRRRAALDQTSPAVLSTIPTVSFSKLEAQYKAQQMEISQLRKERDNTISRLKKLEEALPQRCVDLANRIEQHNSISEMLQPVLDRLAALEQRPLEFEFPSLRKELEELKTGLNRLDAVEESQRATALPSLQKDMEELNPVLGRPDALEKSVFQKKSADLKPLSDRIDGLEADSSKRAKGFQNALDQIKNANSTVGGFSALKKDIVELKNLTGVQMTDIAALKSWKDSLPKVLDEEAMKQRVLQELLTRTDDPKNVLRSEVKAVETRLATRITEEQKKVSQLQTNMTTSLTFKETIEKQKLDGRLTDFTSKLREVEANNNKTYKKTTRLENSIVDLEKDTRKLEEDSQTFDKDIDKLFATGKKANEALDDLRKDIEEYIGPIQAVYDKTGLTVLERLANFTTTVGQVPRHQSELNKMTSGQNAITTELNKLSARLDVLEKVASNPTAAPGPGPGHKKVGESVTPSSPKTSNENFPDLTHQRMDQLDKEVKGFRQALEEAKGLAAKFESVEAQLAASEKRTIDDAVKLDNQLSEKMRSVTTALGHRLSAVETCVEKLNDVSGNTRARPSNVDTRVENLEAAPGSAPHPTIQSDKTIIQDISEIREGVGQLDAGLSEVEKTIHQHNIEIGALQNNLTLLFKDNFDPFKQSVEEQLGTINSKLEAYGVDVNGLKKHVSASRAQPRQSGFGEAQQTQLRSLAHDAINLKAVVDGLQKALQAETEARGHELCTKADAQSIKDQMEAFNYSLNHLESRYDNITTDEVYQRMVHWFSQTYPNATAVTNYPQIQQDVNQLKAFQRQISWIQNYSQELNGIFRNAPQLRTLISNAPQLQDLLTKLPQLQALVTSHSELSATLVKVEQACSDAKTAIAKSDQAEEHMDQQLKTIESIKTAILGLQTSYRSLNSQSSPFVRTEALNRLETTIQALKDQVGEEQKERLGSINGQRTMSGEQHDKWVKVEEQLKSSINELKQMKTELEPKVTQIAEQVGQIQASSSQLRQDFDTMNNTLVEPNREFLGLLAIMFVVVAQMQQVIDSQNENLPIALKYNWEHYLPTLGQSETNGDDATKGKGKGKSKQ